MSSEEKALRIEYVRLDKAIGLLWQKNPKRHALDSLAASFRQHGFRDAPAFDANLQEGGAIVDGNGRVETLGWMHDQGQEPPIGILLDKEDGMWCVPIQFGIDAPSREAAESYALDANSLVMAGAEFTAWDMARLWDDEGYLEVLRGLAEADLLPVSVDLEDFVDLMASLNFEEPPEDPGVDISKADELQRVWQTCVGQVWELGDLHRLAVGDCTDPAVVESVMWGERADAVVTDLPYNIGKDYGAWDDKLPEKTYWGVVVPAWLATFAGVLNRPGHLVTTFSERGMNRLIQMAEQVGFQHRHTGVWHNPNRLAGGYPGQWPFAWEPILDFTVGGWRRLNNKNAVGYSDVWVLPSPIGVGNGPYHPAEKPVELYEDLVGLVSDRGDVILEPCAGTGTTMAACQRLGRKCRGIEISPAYCAVTLERLAGMGLEPHLLEG